MSRAQANLPALAVALLLVGGSVGVAVGLAGSAFAGADTDPEDGRLAASVAERLVSADGPLAVRANVLSRAAVERADEALVDDVVPGDAAVRVTLDGDPIATRGDPTGGVTMRRVVLVADVERRELAVAAGQETVTLPRRTSNATLTVDTRSGTRLTTVRANDRVVLHDDAGLDGAYDVALSRYDTVSLSFDATADLAPGSVTVAYRSETTTKAVLEVTADA